MSFANQVAVITGASTGIGHALARALAAERCRVGLVARRGMLKYPPAVVHVPAEIVDRVRNLLAAWQALDGGTLTCDVIGLAPGDRVELSDDHYVTAFPTADSDYESHIRRLLLHAELDAMLWANIDLKIVTFTAIKKNRF